MTFDPHSVRDQFPILSRQVNGCPLVYLDNAASAQKPNAVIDTMSDRMRQSYANVHRGLHTMANETTEAYEAARAKVAGFLNASPDEIVFTRGGTEAINLVAGSLGVSMTAGDEIIVTEMEHHSNIVPWHLLRERKGVVLRFARVADDGSLDVEHLISLLGPRTRLVALTQMSNVLGTINPVKAVSEAAHAAGALVLVDGCQGAVHATPDVREIDCDFYVFTGHKLYGPTGIGVLYGKAEHLKRMPPYQGGGEMINEVTTENVTYNDPPHRFEAGTPAIVQAIGLGAALDYMRALGLDNIAAHEATLRDYAMQRLSEINSLRIYGRAKNKGAIVSFNMQGAHAHDVATVIDRAGVAVRAGTHCTQPLLARFGVTATCRASFAMYNTREEVDKLAEALISAQRIFL